MTALFLKGWKTSKFFLICVNKLYMFMLQIILM